MSAITLRGVAKRYGDVAALRGIDLEIDPGEVFGFLGPNGAGKSTTIDMLHYAHPSAGTVEVLGRDVTADPVAVRQRVGILPEGFAPFETMTGRQHLAYAIEANGPTTTPTRCSSGSVSRASAIGSPATTRRGWPSGSRSRWRWWASPTY